MKNRSIDWIQGLRGIAALLVVFVHARYVLRGTPSEGFAESLFMPGAMGVDLFFLISGFIMVYTTRNSNGSLLYTVEFLIKRVSRIWPTYAVIATLGVALLMPTDHFLSFLNIETMLKSLLFLPIAPDTPPFFSLPWGLGWTLNFEMYFYLFFGLSMLAGRHRGKVLSAWIFCALVLIPLATKGTISLDPQNNYGFDSIYLNLATNPIVWLFPAGMIIGFAYLSPIRLPKGYPSTFLVVASAALAIWSAYSGLFKFHGISHWGGPLALALLVFSISNLEEIVKPPPALMWLGKVSFSLYLSHPIAQGVTSKMLRGFGHEELIHTWSYIFMTTILALILAQLCYSLLEVRLSNFTKEKLLQALDLAFGRKNQSPSTET